ncbi:YifB family Mg chelatase-like AAA ATPase [Stackebrandtia nassauensis]|uniref:Magnesium chelatase ChlI subunit n=1 Tax=Stackebrandtia nassauensis (strain DSM 44728 / CIP 108903 / NRRL B-16338 / NBRC 102104 / LLR-40K-21) TaxID=446470 RepID=D3PV10_STANL|nr:ATP-binding protein [Stackebrandtia nassauensis]ADD45034.1 magnesium chelatase ChlI subunit [Stackebrandtia nassauensis DSM 44728]
MESTVNVGVAHTVAMIGLTATPVSVTASNSAGGSGFTMPQLPDYLADTTTSGIFAAWNNSDLPWPGGAVEIRFDFTPGVSGLGGCELAIAVAVARAAGLAPHDSPPAPTRMYAQLGIDGSLRATRGARPAAFTASTCGDNGVIVAAADHADVGDITGIAIRPAADLRGALRQLRSPTASAKAPTPPSEPLPKVDLHDILGLVQARHGLEIAAAGGHHMILLGAPDAGAVMLAERLPGILPPLTQHQADQVADIRSLAGQPYVGPGLTPPYSAPHHSSTMAAMVGSSTMIPRPGAISQAHNGVLFLDEAAEFRRDVLDTVLPAVAHQHLLITRYGDTIRLPARLHLVMASGMCPKDHPRRDCNCGPAARRYLHRLAGRLMDHVLIRIQLPDPPPYDELCQQSRGDSSATVRARVIAARRAAGERWSGRGADLTNQDVPVSLLRSPRFRLSATTMAPMTDRFADRTIPVRHETRLLRLAWTLADLDGTNSPCVDHVADAMRLGGFDALGGAR